MNSSLVHEQSRRLVEAQGCREADFGSAGAGASDRVSSLFQVVYGRPATISEQQRALDFLRAVEPSFTAVADGGEVRLQAWSALCRTLIAGNQFLFVD
jgi:hypothetical protein